MSARQDRQWWPISSKLPPLKHNIDPTRSFHPSDKPRKHSVGMKLSSITSAMGFRSKKHPTLAIQEPPPDIRPKPARVDTQTVRYPNRPPAKSVSTVQSWDDPNEPQTPLDVVKGGMPRVLTTSDPDPYSSRGIRGFPITQDPNRLSAYSGSSISDTLSKKNESAIAFKRLSDASSFSQYLGADLSPTSSSASLHGSISGRRPSSSKRSTTQRRKPSLLAPIDPTCSSWNGAGNMSPSGNSSHPSLSKSNSSSTLKETSRLGEPDSSAAPHSTTRRRGMTDTGSISSNQSRSQILRNASSQPRTSLHPPPNDQPPSPISPRLVRQSSISRIGPPSAPPSGELPAPPMTDSLSVDEETGLRPVSRGSSSSSLSFASLGRVPLKEIGSRKTQNRESSSPSNPKSSGGHTVKRSISHQNFSKRPSYNLATGSGSCTPAEQLEDKSPRRQRSYNSRIVSPPRQPPPPVPSQQPQSPLPPTSPESSTFADQRRSTGTGTSVRKRLFSGGSSVRRPVSQTFSAGDDHQSVFTADGEQSQAAKSPVPSLWDDGGPSDRSPGSPVPSTSEYTPQMIVSPAEMLRMEASFNEGSDEYDYGYFSRQRVHSLASPSKAMSADRNGVEGLPPPVSPTHYIIDRACGTSSGAKRSPSMTGSGLSSPLRHSLRPSTSQNNMTGACLLFPFSKPSSPSIGLPPPPRPRRQTVITTKDTPVTLPPTPPTPASILRRVNTTTGARSSAPLVRSIMRKPSFLDIEDETYQKRPLSVASAFASSFLDLDRGKDSFDTIRSEDEQEFS